MRGLDRGENKGDKVVEVLFLRQKFPYTRHILKGFQVEFSLRNRSWQAVPADLMSS